MTRYPLLLGFHDLVAGNGYIAGIALSNGRALLVDEGDGFWMYGVNPGGMAAIASRDLQLPGLAYPRNLATGDILV
jgi:hypothetical protein